MWTSEPGAYAAASVTTVSIPVCTQETPVAAVPGLASASWRTNKSARTRTPVRPARFLLPRVRGSPSAEASSSEGAYAPIPVPHAWRRKPARIPKLLPRCRLSHRLFLSHGPDAAARGPHSFYGIEFSASSDSGPYQTNEVASPAEGLGVLAVHRARAELWKTWTFGENA